MDALRSPLTFTEIAQHFSFLEKSDTRIEDADILFLATAKEANENQQKRISWLIQKLYKFGDVVLVESEVNRPDSCLETRFLAQPISLRGWNFERRNSQTEQKKRLIRLLVHIETVRKSGLTRKNWMLQIQQLQNMAPPTEENGDTTKSSFQSNYTEETLALLKSPQERLNCFDTHVSMLSQLWTNYVKANHDATQIHSIMQSIQTHLPHSQRLFIITKTAYLSLNPRLHEEHKDALEATNLLHLQCADKKYVVINPHNDVVGLKEIEQELQSPSTSSSSSRCSCMYKTAQCCKRVALCFAWALLCVGTVFMAVPYLLCKRICSCCGSIFRNSTSASLEKQSTEELLLLLSQAALNPKTLPQDLSFVVEVR